jgi:hypothetical protein
MHGEQFRIGLSIHVVRERGKCEAGLITQWQDALQRSDVVVFPPGEPPLTGEAVTGMSSGRLDEDDWSFHPAASCPRYL